MAAASGANAPITWAQLGVIIAIVLPFAGALYMAIRDGQQETNTRLKSIEDTLQKAIPVLANAPKLEETVNKAHDNVIMLQENIKQLAPIPQQIQAIQTQLSNIQAQVHTIPGVKR
jgi:uncharacterized phage infection (PIP) family protein YhgE